MNRDFFFKKIMRFYFFIWELGILIIVASCTPEASLKEQIELATERVGDSLLENSQKHPQNWLTYGQTYSEERFSQLDQIHTGNVENLGLAWALNLGTKRGLEATPLVVEGFMFVSGPWGWVYAINARDGKIVWTYDPQVPGFYGQKACCDVVNRGVALYEGKVYVGTLDGRLVALRASTGEVLWEKWTVDSTQAYTLTGAPRIVEGMVLIGNSGAEFGVRGYISAYDATSGELAWRFYTVPGNPQEGFEKEAMEKAARTWSGEWWRYGGGGTVWDAIVYDAALGYLYIGTGNGSPWDRNHRSPEGGDNLFLSSIIALEASTGEYVWHYQTTPGDSWDFTATQSIILADISWKGEPRKVLFQAPKNGFFYILDRIDGTLLSAEPYVYVNWANGVDSLTGRPIETPLSRYEDQNVQVLPSPSGGHNWQPMAFHPNLGLVYFPAREEAMTFGHNPYWKYDSSGISWNLGIRYNSRQSTWVDSLAPRVLPSEKLIAWDPKRQKVKWEVPQEGIYNGGVLATAGDLVFQGTATGKFCAYQASTGQLLWEYDLKSGIIAPPISYSIDGIQYISIAARMGRGRGSIEEIYPDYSTRNGLHLCPP